MSYESEVDSFTDNDVREQSVVLVGGGLDSAVCICQALADGKSVFPLYIDYGQATKRQELAAFRSLWEHLDSMWVNMVNIRNVTMSRFEPYNYVTMRNTVFAMMAYNTAAAIVSSEVIIGVTAEADDADTMPDCTPEWVELVRSLYSNECAGSGIMEIEFSAPLVNVTRDVVAEMAADYGIPKGMMWSCLTPNSDGSACGSCFGCQKVI